MNFNKFTLKAQEAVQQAQQIAMARSNQAIEPVHLLKGMIEVDEHVLPFLFQKIRN